MKRIGILSDTHGMWDDRFAIHFADCDEVWHAGDVGDYDIIERLADIVPTVRAVAGNVDTGMVRRKCPELDIFTVEDVKVLMTHIGGYPGRWAPGMKKLLRENGIGLMVEGYNSNLSRTLPEASSTRISNLSPFFSTTVIVAAFSSGPPPTMVRAGLPWAFALMTL